MEKNHEKAGEYAKNKVKLKKAIDLEFYLEAIFIEYSMIEDRTASLLTHAGIKATDKNEHGLPLGIKVNDLKNKPIYETRAIRSKLPIVFLDEIMAWAKKRNDLVHSLLKIGYTDEEIKNVALQGKELVRQLENKTKSINRILDKE